MKMAGNDCKWFRIAWPFYRVGHGRIQDLKIGGWGIGRFSFGSGKTGSPSLVFFKDEYFL